MIYMVLIVYGIILTKINTYKVIELIMQKLLEKMILNI